MNIVQNFIQNFLNRAGSYVLLTTVFSRILSFTASWIALQLIDNKELGVVIFAFNIVSFISPIGGFGLHQSLIRYGALLKSDTEKNSLFIYVFKKGLLASLIIILLIIITSFFIDFSFSYTRYYLIFLSFIIIPSYLFELIKIQFRLNYDNKSFSFSELTYTIILVVCVTLLSYFFKEKGYAIALLLTPILTCLFFIKKIKIDYNAYSKLEITDFYFWKYGFFASLSNVVTQLLFVIDLFLIGYLLNDANMVTNYKYITLIPFSILFLPRAFNATDFVAYTENIHNKKYINNYIKGYMTLFSFVSFFAILFSFLFSHHLLKLFDPKFIKYNDSFHILMIGICGILIFRGIFGNLLSSIGKAQINYYITSIALLLNIVSNNYFIPIYGIKGAAITTSILMWLTGIVSFIWFKILYKNLTPKPSS
ncbi:MAG TPA: hypothetical protein DDZ39_01360 [Flavobacteriaceae bacterium]|nr:hypothetical protein [Flavobacteriaceae bacterium]HBS12205.1 hypothetical protein [Flavobacteriaceae bacterium]